MPEQDIYKLVEQLNRNKNISKNEKIDDIYSLLDKLESNSNIVEDEKIQRNAKTLSSLKNKTKPIIKPSFPTQIRPFTKRSDCFINILQAINYGDTNADYKDGHEDALEKYYSIASNNNKDFYVIEAQVNEEIESYKRKVKDDFYTKGYYDGLEYVFMALEKSKEMLAQKINNILLKELS